MDTGDTAWVLASCALVLFMTPGLAFFYGGMVRSKNLLAMLMQNFFAMGLISVLWVLVGFSLAFGEGNDFIGDLSFAGLADIATADFGFAAPLTIPAIAFCAFQMMFAIITPALITGATADRLKFGGMGRLPGPVERPRLLARWPTGCSAPTAGCSRRAPSTSPAAPSSTSTPASPRWS